MKNKIKKYIASVILLIMINMSTIVFATGRLVDIPVPPNSTGYADFTEEEAAEREKQYIESQNNAVTAEDFVGKSSDNYLKSINVEGYKLYPKFNRQNDTYTIYVKNREELKTLNITAEADNENAKIEGVGIVEINPEQKIINIKVTAENGNLKVYSINIENKNEKFNINIKIIICFIIIIIVTITVIILIKRFKHDN